MKLGTISESDVGKLRFINDKNYLNNLQEIYDGANRTFLPVAPFNKFQMLGYATNGMQFSPDLNDGSHDKIQVYDSDLFTLNEYYSDGSFEEVSNIKGKVYKLKDQ